MGSYSGKVWGNTLVDQWYEMSGTVMRAEIWDTVAAIRDRDGDATGAERAKAAAAVMRP
jgi:hypothetical protein